MRTKNFSEKKTLHSKKQQGKPAKIGLPNISPGKKAPTPPPAPVFREETPEEPMDAMSFAALLDQYGMPPEDMGEPIGKRKKNPDSIVTLNLEDGRPTVEEALFTLSMGLVGAKARGCHVIRLIHGYGSSGVGGKIRMAVQSQLKKLQSQRKIADFVPGEEFGPIVMAQSGLGNRYPFLKKDPDYGKCNHGITMVFL